MSKHNSPPYSHCQLQTINCQLLIVMDFSPGGAHKKPGLGWFFGDGSHPGLRAGEGLQARLGRQVADAAVQPEGALSPPQGKALLEQGSHLPKNMQLV
jgi:hypothetical protein